VVKDLNKLTLKKVVKNPEHCFSVRPRAGENYEKFGCEHRGQRASGGL